LLASVLKASADAKALFMLPTDAPQACAKEVKDKALMMFPFKEHRGKRTSSQPTTELYLNHTSLHGIAPP